MRAPHLTFEALSIGAELPSVVKGPMTTAHIMRWSAATENWHRIHYDWRFATEHDGLPNVLVNGTWKQHVLIQLLKDWAGDDAWVWKTAFRFNGNDVVGDTLQAWGRVTGKQRRGAFGVASVAVGLRNPRGEDSTSGTADVVFPLAGGPPFPNPFDPSVVLQPVGPGDE